MTRGTGEYQNFFSLSNNRKLNPDYSHCVPTALRINYIDPNGKFRYAEVAVTDVLNLDTYKQLVAMVKADAHSPLDEAILQEEFDLVDASRIAKVKHAIDISEQITENKQTTLNEQYR